MDDSSVPVLPMEHQETASSHDSMETDHQHNAQKVSRVLHSILATRLKMTKSLQELNNLSRWIPQHMAMAPYLKLSPYLYEVLEHQNVSAHGSGNTDESPIGAYVERVLGMLHNEATENSTAHHRECDRDHQLTSTTQTDRSHRSASPTLTMLDTTNTNSTPQTPFQSIWQHIGPDWPPNSVPIRCDVTSFEWDRLARFIQFDVVMMDPPWQLASSNPTRGVALAYAQLSDTHIQALPMRLIAKPDSFLFLWVINAKYQLSLQLIREWGYTFVDEITWVKHTKNRRLAKSHGYYLQHAKESCLVAVKGHPQHNKAAQISDVIFSERRAQSQKPSEIYSYIEELMPGGQFLEIFGRKNNLRSGWTTVGNEI
mmetsp:Transcript_2466/g.9284  ORF Transcript_2466/g.9284 Transcript_2466/m.9284 type:complete len:370 (-) Transcript_2466:1958-3067(-)